MKLTREQYNMWSAALADGWKFDAQNYILWGGKEVYTDSKEDERGIFYRATLKYYEERNGTGYLAQSTGRQLPTIVVDRWTKTRTDGVYSSVQILKETIGEPQTKKNYSVLAKLTAFIDISAYFAKAAEADTGKEYNTMLDFVDSNEEQEDAKEAEENPQETNNEPEEVADTAAEMPAEETQETATEDAPKADTLTEEAAPDMFATFAAAYLSGQTIKSAQKDDTKPAEPEETPQEEAHEEPPRDGYDKTSNFFTVEEVSRLSDGVPVAKKASYNSAVYFTVTYSDGVKLIYYVSSYDERDRVNAGRDAKFWGVMIGEVVYISNDKDISAKMAEDVNRYLLEHVKSESDAAHAAANAGEYERGRINEAKERDIYGEAQRAFYDHKPPELVLYYRDNSYSYGWDTIIEYLTEPQKAIEKEALRHLCEKPHEVYISYILYNRISATYGEIKSNTGSEEHKLLKISDCIKEQKTVKIELLNGKKVTVEAGAVRRIIYSGYISPYSVFARDRQFLEKNEYGHDKDIKAADIVSISHGGRVLYRAS